MWEYQVVYAFSDSDTNSSLKNAGNDNWELVTVIRNDHSNVLYFKRKKETIIL